MNSRIFFPQEIIRRKRDGAVLDEAEISVMVRGLADGSISEGQVAAFAMAVFFRGMERAECVSLTRAMTESGEVLDWSGLGRPVLDKHSTGGVGDKASLMLAPILAACGAAVPMISGRGLGHTGGTLDKLDSIPGYDTAPGLDRFRDVVRQAGCAIIGQTPELAPADRRFYAVRDVTATVESIPLITASILSKKLAAGLGGLVMDVKVGNGAFMATLDEAKALAESIVGVARGAGLPTVALITDMNQVLGRTVGNALELSEAIDYLTGPARDARLHEVVMALGQELLLLGGLVPERSAAALIAGVLDDGSAVEAFARMVAGLGGPKDLVEAPARYLPEAPVIRPAPPRRTGTIRSIDTRAVGLAVMALGGGRRRADDAIDYGVGFTEVVGLGQDVGPDCPLATVFARDQDTADEAVAALQEAFEVGDPGQPPAPVVIGRIDGAAET